jgi:phosphatidylserine decarboxylase
VHHLQGSYYSVKPVAVRSPIDVYDSNKRSIFEMDCAHFGQVLYIAIAAVQVGSIKWSVSAEDRVKKVSFLPTVHLGP